MSIDVAPVVSALQAVGIAVAAVAAPVLLVAVAIWSYHSIGAAIFPQWYYSREADAQDRADAKRHGY